MFPVSEEFHKALLSGAVQHINGTLTLLTGEEIRLDDSNLIGAPEVERQCTEETDIFQFGQLYTGTMELTLDAPTLMREELRGGEISLYFGVNDEDIPLGAWTVTDPQRDSSGRLRLKCCDCISKLDIPTNVADVGSARIQKHLDLVSRLTGVDFAQTADDLAELAGYSLSWLFSVEYAKTCRQEVANIAQLLGGFACSDRYGRIVFRRFGTQSVLEIPAELRFSADLNEYTYAVGSVSYTDSNGVKFTQKTQRTDSPNTSADLGFSGNIFFLSSLTEENYHWWLDGIAQNLAAIPTTTPGELRWYGDPTLDLGDVVTLRGGKSDNSRFLITSERWGFRSPQTLICAGAGDSSGGSSTVYSSGSSSAAATINLTKNNVIIDFEKLDFPQNTAIYEAAECCFSARSDTAVLVTVNAVFDGSGEIHILLDGIMQTSLFRTTIVGTRTADMSIPLNVSAGHHRVSIEAEECIIQRINAAVFGQDITEYHGETTFDDEYRFSGGIVQKYLGISAFPRIPSTLGGEAVRVIGEGAFADSDVEFVEIPEGVEEIK